MSVEPGLVCVARSPWLVCEEGPQCVCLSLEFVRHSAIAWESAAGRGLSDRCTCCWCWRSHAGCLFACGVLCCCVAAASAAGTCRFKPAPIYILDEVDAALDLNHTQNIGAMIKQHFPQVRVCVTVQCVPGQLEQGRLASLGATQTHSCLLLPTYDHLC